MNMKAFTFLSFLPPLILMNSCNGWDELYNGQDLDGWHVECRTADRGKNFWKAGDGYIECNSLGDPEHDYVWLMSDREFDDFQLRLEFQVYQGSTGNSGLQFRSRYDRSDDESGEGWLNGPQVDIHPPDPYRTGLIYDETRGVQRWIYPSLPDWEIVPDSAPREARRTVLYYADDDPDSWNSLELICQGMQIRTFVNGKRVTNFDATGILNDEKHQKHGVGSRGHIALQLHSKDRLQIRFRNILIREMNN